MWFMTFMLYLTGVKATSKLVWCPSCINADTSHINTSTGKPQKTGMYFWETEHEWLYLAFACLLGVEFWIFPFVWCTDIGQECHILFSHLSWKRQRLRDKVSLNYLDLNHQIKHKKAFLEITIFQNFVL